MGGVRWRVNWMGITQNAIWFYFLGIFREIKVVWLLPRINHALFLYYFLWQTDSKTALIAPTFWNSGPCCGPFSLSVGRTCDLLLTEYDKGEGMSLRWWRYIKIGTYTLLARCLPYWLWWIKLICCCLPYWLWWIKLPCCKLQYATVSMERHETAGITSKELNPSLWQSARS